MSPQSKLQSSPKREAGHRSHDGFGTILDQRGNFAGKWPATGSIELTYVGATGESVQVAVNDDCEDVIVCLCPGDAVEQSFSYVVAQGIDRWILDGKQEDAVSVFSSYRSCFRPFHT